MAETAAEYNAKVIAEARPALSESNRALPAARCSRAEDHARQS